jgi:GNAT superfamily N-acetyltransferase
VSPVVTAEVSIREAMVTDVTAIRRLLPAHGNDGPVVTVDVIGPYLRHLLDHHRVLVSVQRDVILAFGAVVDTGLSMHLADLFVAPDRLGEGIGRPLLEALFADAPRRTTFASDDPRALPLYARSGMAPLWPNLYLEGTGDALPAPPPSMTLEPADGTRLSALEAEWTGHGRLIDQGYWATPAGDGFIMLEDRAPVAIAWARVRQTTPVRTLNRMVIRPDVDPVVPVLAAIRRAARGGSVVATIPGPHPALPVLLNRGFRITDRDQYCASDPSLVDPIHLLPNGGML